MVSPAGFEPTAPRLGISCSILLSYGDAGREDSGPLLALQWQAGATARVEDHPNQRSGIE